MLVVEFLDELIEQVRENYGLATHFVMPSAIYREMLREFREINPFIREIEEYNGIPITVSPTVRFDTVFLMPFDITARNEDNDEN